MHGCFNIGGLTENIRAYDRRGSEAKWDSRLVVHGCFNIGGLTVMGVMDYIVTMSDLIVHDGHLEEINVIEL